MYGNMFWQFFAMIIGFGGLAWYNTKGIEMLTYGRNWREQKPLDVSLSKQAYGERTLVQLVEERLKMMHQKKGICAKNARKKKLNVLNRNGNRSCVTWNGNLLDGASPPLNRNGLD